MRVLDRCLGRLVGRWQGIRLAAEVGQGVQC